jgi:hypothetical protein
MDLTQSRPSQAAKTAPVLPQQETPVRSNDARPDLRSEVRSEVRSDVRGPSQATPRKFFKESRIVEKSPGYGMPCANCHLYYPANFDSCPCCGSQEQVSPEVAPAARISAPVAAEPQPDLAALEREREAFLKQFKSQELAVKAEPANTPANCVLGGRHADAAEPAAVCKPCYDQLQQRVDVFEAALHIELKDAAQIVYDAVWADPSDPAQTYANAAAALLDELRKRSGVSTLLGPFQPLGN